MQFVTLEMQQQWQKGNAVYVLVSCIVGSRDYVHSSLEIAGGIDSAVRVGVRVGGVWRQAGARGALLPPDAISGRLHVVVLRHLLALLLAPESPCDNGETSEEDGSTNASNDATNNGLGMWCERAA